MQLINFNAYPDSTFTVDLGQKIIALRLTWNEVVQSWYMAVADMEGNEIVGIKVVPNYPLLDCSRAEAPISGDFICYRKEELAPERITFDSLSTSWGLCWLTDAELAEWMVDNGLG